MELVAIGISFSAIIVSFVSFYFNWRHSKTLVLADVITRQRIEWLGNVRTSITDFINACLFDDEIKNILEKKYRVELYLNPEKIEVSESITEASKQRDLHKALIISMNKCASIKLEHGDMETAIEDVVAKAQDVLDMTWKIAKGEATFVRKEQTKKQRKNLNV